MAYNLNASEHNLVPGVEVILRPRIFKIGSSIHLGLELLRSDIQLIQKRLSFANLKL